MSIKTQSGGNDITTVYFKNNSLDRVVTEVYANGTLVYRMKIGMFYGGQSTAKNGSVNTYYNRLIRVDHNGNLLGNSLIGTSRTRSGGSMAGGNAIFFGGSAFTNNTFTFYQSVNIIDYSGSQVAVESSASTGTDFDIIFGSGKAVGSNAVYVGRAKTVRLNSSGSMIGTVKVITGFSAFGGGATLGSSAIFYNNNKTARINSNGDLVGTVKTINSLSTIDIGGAAIGSYAIFLGGGNGNTHYNYREIVNSAGDLVNRVNTAGVTSRRGVTGASIGNNKGVFYGGYTLMLYGSTYEYTIYSLSNVIDASGNVVGTEKALDISRYGTSSASF